MSKVCTRCGRELDESEFQRNGVRNGVQRYKSQCRDCLNAVTKARYQAQKELLAEFKDVCAKCGETRAVVLDFHHVDPDEKDFTIGQVSLRSAKQLYNEVKKCVVLCANCHREFHWLAQHEGITLDDYLGTAR